MELINYRKRRRIGLIKINNVIGKNNDIVPVVGCSAINFPHSSRLEPILKAVQTPPVLKRRVLITSSLVSPHGHGPVTDAAVAAAETDITKK